MYHNHEENIIKARMYAKAFKEYSHVSISISDASGIVELLESMIADAIEGHAKIEELEKKIDHELSDETKIAIKGGENAKLPD